MRLTDFNYEFPPELIARYPLEKRSDSRLLCVDRQTGELQHRQFIDILELLTPNDLLVCNNSRVISARLFGTKATGGQVEMLVERVLDQRSILAHIRASKSPKPASILYFPENISFEVLQRHGDLYELRCLADATILTVLETIGQVPLPPYFNRAPEASDKERYQTIYAQHDGSVAAPTAGLHFDQELFARLAAKGVSIAYVTLHVGAGTFAPVRVDDITEHQMHYEYIHVSAELCEQVQQTKARGGRVIAVGTTAVRSLETASLPGTLQPFSGDTNIFIYPGFQFQCVDGLITNLHLPGSTLLMLVAAFAGYESMQKAYQVAVAERYRFFSYGDAMFIV